MSWGERSCVNHGNCKYEPKMGTCNVDCMHYTWDEHTMKDSETKYPELTITRPVLQKPKLNRRQRRQLSKGKSIWS